MKEVPSTLPKTKIATENSRLEDDISFWDGYVSFKECIFSEQLALVKNIFPDSQQKKKQKQKTLAEFWGDTKY